MRCAVALSAIAARADEHLSLTPRTQKQPGIVHRSPRRRGLDDPTSPGNTGLGAVRQCGSVAQPRTLTAKSLRSEAASVSSPSPISLQPLNDVTLAHEATALCDQHHRFAGETTASQRRGRGAASEHVRPRRRIRLRRAVRRISALLRSHQQTESIPPSGSKKKCLCRSNPCLRRMRPKPPPVTDVAHTRTLWAPCPPPPDTLEGDACVLCRAGLQYSASGAPRGWRMTRVVDRAGRGRPSSRAERSRSNDG